ncbi:MAG: VWA domain-containing protein [Sphingobacteriales bacterium]|uniref:vWA domain-containing protein n=1 Tax=Hydrotalea flava TaxID=714549 RepID=UPI00082C9F60|nr:VWA domain-containing protein [Hydrotalea flava]RTL47377.1 MAG: VWA domain-containing protein [Sphingobacteriales bacterium]
MLSAWLQHTEFAYPWVLPLLLVVPYLVYWYIKTYRQQIPAVRITTTHFLRGTAGIKSNLKHVPFVLRLLALSAIVIALARPREQFTRQQINGRGINIILCIDISGSMTEQDFVPNRLEAAKKVATSFVESRPGDEIGVVIFSSQSFTLCPLTVDHATVLNQINNIQNGYLQEEGTAIGSGLATSVDRLRNSTNKSKVIILLTDGVDFGGQIPPDVALNMAKLYGIKVYTIGVGSNANRIDDNHNPLSNVTSSPLDFNEGLLKQLAAETGGQYYHATDNAALQNIYKSIDRLEKSNITVTTYKRYTEQFQWFVWVALVLVVLEVLLRLTVLRKFP